MGAIADSTPTAWWDADALGLSNGASVSSLPDSSGNGYDANQANVSYRPTYKTGVSPTGLDAIEFNGTRYLTAINSLSAVTGTQTYAAVVWVYPGTTTPRTIIGSTTSGGIHWYLNSAHKPELTKAGVALIGTAGTALPQPANATDYSAGKWSVVFVENVNTTSYRFELNGSADGNNTHAVTYSGSGIINIGAYATLAGQFLFHGLIGEVVRWNRTLTSTERADVQAELEAKWITGSNTDYVSAPPISGASQATDGPICMGVRFAATEPGCYLKGIRFYYANWAPVLGTTKPLATLYTVGGAVELVTPVEMEPPITALPDVVGGFGARNVLDPSTANRWLAAKPTVGSPAWVAVYTDEEQVMTDYKITPYTTTTAPKDFTLEGSNDGGATWTTLDTRVGVAWPNTNEQTFAIASPQPFQKYRLHVTANNGDATYLAIVCWKFTGYTVSPLAWVTAWLPSWFPLTEDTEYRAVIHFRTSGRPSSSTALPSATIVNGPLTVTAPHTYAYGASMTNPTSSAGGLTNYLLDVVLSDAAEGPSGGLMLGGASVDAIKVGSAGVDRVYLGDQQVYTATPPGPD